MKRLAWFIIPLLVVLAALFAGRPSDVPVALAHDRGDFLPQLPSAAQKKIIDRGYGLYRLDVRSSAFPGYRADIQKMYADECERTRICWYETFSTAEYDMLWEMPNSWPYGGNVAGIAWYYEYPARVEINWRLPYVSFITTQGHEQGHIDGLEDMYFHPLTCRLLKWTKMSCGTGIWWVTDYDRDIMWNVYVPDVPSHVGAVSDGVYLWIAYNSIRASSVGCVPFAGAESLGGNASERDNFCGHPTRYLDNVTKVAIFARDPGGDWWFTGYYGPPAPLNGYASRGFALSDWCVPGRVFGVRPENGLTLTWHPSVGGLPYLGGDVALAGACP